LNRANRVVRVGFARKQALRFGFGDFLFERAIKSFNSFKEFASVSANSNNTSASETAVSKFSCCAKRVRAASLLHDFLRRSESFQKSGAEICASNFSSSARFAARQRNLPSCSTLTFISSYFVCKSVNSIFYYLCCRYSGFP
jgi:hypothetical protein